MPMAKIIKEITHKSRPMAPAKIEFSIRFVTYKHPPENKIIPTVSKGERVK